ncbi:MAG: potassium channel protein [Planctomycetota bacterium]
MTSAADAIQSRRAPRDRTIQRAVLLIVAIVVFGTGGYTWIEGWTPWQAMFFTLVTLTTVGYGDYGLSHAGERFTALLMIGGIGTVSYTASQIIQNAISRTRDPEKRMRQQASKLRGHYVICGLGRTGQHVIAKLIQEGAEVVAIDKDPKKVELMRQRGIIAFERDATSDAALIMAGADRAAGIAAVTASDAINALICITAHAMAPDVTITARAEDDASVFKLKRAGATSVIAPTSYGGDGIAENLLRPEVARLLPGLQDEGFALQFAEVKISERSPYRGQSVEALGRAYPRLVFIASRDAEGDVTLRPEPNHTLIEGEVLIVAGTSHDVRRFGDSKRAA